MFARDLNKVSLGNAKYSITQTFTFDASHNLNMKDFEYLNRPGSLVLQDLSKCFVNHGHTYKLHVTWTGAPTDDRPMIYPFGQLKRFARELVAKCDHQNLNEAFVFPTTLENLANWFYKRLQIYNDETIRVSSVELWEGENNRVTVEQP
jgi:6-pyruvoyl tetrahydropterin synthase/QueD family protein